MTVPLFAERLLPINAGDFAQIFHEETKKGVGNYRIQLVPTSLYMKHMFLADVHHNHTSYARLWGLQAWKDAEKLLAWFKLGLARDYFASLDFPTTLTKEDRAFIHR